MYSKNTNSYPKCGEIWMCNLPKSDGSIQSGYRPVFILSNDKNNTYAPTLNIIPITSKMNKRKLPVHVEIWNYAQVGLKMPSTMLIEQITTIECANLDRCIGVIDDEYILTLIRRAIRIQFPIASM